MPGCPRAQHPHCTPQAQNPGKEKRWIIGAELQHGYKETFLAYFFSQVDRFHRRVKLKRKKKKTIKQKQKAQHILPTDTHTNNGSGVCFWSLPGSGTDLELKGGLPLPGHFFGVESLRNRVVRWVDIGQPNQTPWQGKGPAMIKFRFSTVSAFPKSVLLLVYQEYVGLVIMLLKILHRKLFGWQLLIIRLCQLKMELIVKFQINSNWDLFPKK